MLASMQHLMIIYERQINITSNYGRIFFLLNRHVMTGYNYVILYIKYSIINNNWWYFSIRETNKDDQQACYHFPPFGSWFMTAYNEVIAEK